MSIYTKFSSVLRKQKALTSINGGEGIGSSSSSAAQNNNSTHTPTSSSISAITSGNGGTSTGTVSPSRTYAKSTRGSTKPGEGSLAMGAESLPSPQALIRSKITSPARNPSTGKKVVSVSPKTSKLSQTQSLAHSPSSDDDFSNALVLKKKSHGRYCPPTLPPVHRPVVSCLKVGKRTTRDKSAPVEKNRGQTANSGNSIIQKAATVGLASERTSQPTPSSSLPQHPSKCKPQAMKHEGPMDFSDENFDLDKLLAHPQAWMEDNESNNNTIITKKKKSNNVIKPGGPTPSPGQPTTTAQTTQEVEQDSQVAYSEEQNEDWGTVRPKSTQASESSGIPSLTSFLLEDAKEVKESDVVTVDENNNTVLSAIKKTIIRSFSFFDVSATSLERRDDDGAYNNNNNAGQETEEDVVDERSMYSSNNLDEISCIRPEEISSGTSSHQNSAPPATSSATYGIFLRSQDSVLIPLDIEEQLEKAIKQNKLSRPNLQLKNHFASQPKAEEPIPVPVKMQIVSRMEEGKSSHGSSATQLAQDDSTVSFVERKRSFSKQASTVPSFMSAFADERELNAENDGETDTGKECLLDVNGNIIDKVVKHNKQGRTSRSRSRVAFDKDGRDARRGESAKGRKEKLKGLVMAVNTGFGIISVEGTPSTTGTEEPKKSRKSNGFTQQGNLVPANIDTTSQPAILPPVRPPHGSNQAKGTVHRRRIPLSSDERILYPQTYARLGVDHGFPSDIAISNFIGTLVQMNWSSPFSSLTSPSEENIQAKVGSCNHPKVGISSDCGEETSLIATAYDILSAGLKYASKLIGDETDLEPQEDLVRYNGYKIKVFGKELLLESVHVNRDFHINSKSGVRCKSIHSFISLQPHTLSRETLEEQSCIRSGRERRVRIVVRITGSSASQAEQAEKIVELDHYVLHGDGKWTFFLNSKTSSDDGNGAHSEAKTEEADKENKNFIEIGCPTGVHAESLQYGLVNGLLYIDAP